MGRLDGHNAIRLHAEAVGRGLTNEITSLPVGNAALNAGDTELACDELTGALVLPELVEGTQLRFAFDVPAIKISGLRVHSDPAESVRIPSAV